MTRVEGEAGVQQLRVLIGIALPASVTVEEVVGGTVGEVGDGVRGMANIDKVGTETAQGQLDHVDQERVHSDAEHANCWNNGNVFKN